MYSNNSWLVETKKGNDNRMKAADMHYSICPFISKASYKNVRLEKRTDAVANTYEITWKTSRFDVVNIFSGMAKIL